MTIADIARQLDEWFPVSLAEPWDNVGLLLGDRSAPCERVLTCLTVTKQSAAEAVRERASLIVSHHPIFFRPAKRLLADETDGVVYQLARAGVAVYSPHTAFDGGKGGINEQSCARLGLKDVRPLRPAAAPAKYKLVVFTPEGDLETIQRAVFAAGAGAIGDYEECSFRSLGTGGFRGNKSSKPKVGRPGARTATPEWRLEFLVPETVLTAVVAAVRANHSYEEPAFDVYPLHADGSRVGGGRLGRLHEPIPLLEFAAKVRAAFGAAHVEWAGTAAQSCVLVAVGCGAGAEFLDDARRAGCDVLVVGEARFHDLLRAETLGVGLVATGHYASERFALETLAERIAASFPKIVCWASVDEQDPRRIL